MEQEKIKKIGESLPIIQLSYRRDSSPTEPITSSKDAFEYLKGVYDENTVMLKEFCYAMFLDAGNRCIGVLKVSEGGLKATVVDATYIFAAAVLSNASGVILSHNHPSMRNKFSAQDILVTKKVCEVLELDNKNLHDHILFLGDCYESMADSGML